MREYISWSLDGEKPLTSKRINSLTKELVEKFGIPISNWTAHSTRGQGFLMHTEPGLSNEAVCEFGKWKKRTAFSAHPPVGAVDSVKEKIDTEFAHSITPRVCGAEMAGYCRKVRPGSKEGCARTKTPCHEKPPAQGGRQRGTAVAPLLHVGVTPEKKE